MCVSEGWGEKVARAHLVDHPVPGEAGVVDDDVDLAAAKLGALLDQRVDVRIVQHVAGHGQRAAAALVDLLCNLLGLLCLRS